MYRKWEKERKDAASTPSIASFFGRPQARKPEKPDVDTGSNRPAPACTVVLSDDESGPASDPAAGDGAGEHGGGCVGDGGSDAGEYVGDGAGENAGDGAEEQGGTVDEMEQGSYGGGGSVDDVDDGQLPPCPGVLYVLPDSNRLPVADYPFCLHGKGQTPLPWSCTILEGTVSLHAVADPKTGNWACEGAASAYGGPCESCQLLSDNRQLKGELTQ